MKTAVKIAVIILGTFSALAAICLAIDILYKSSKKYISVD